MKDMIMRSQIRHLRFDNTISSNRMVIPETGFQSSILQDDCNAICGMKYIPGAGC